MWSSSRSLLKIFWESITCGFSPRCLQALSVLSVPHPHTSQLCGQLPVHSFSCTSESKLWKMASDHKASSNLSAMERPQTKALTLCFGQQKEVSSAHSLVPCIIKRSRSILLRVNLKCTTGISTEGLRNPHIITDMAERYFSPEGNLFLGKTRRGDCYLK